jgi:riboflavin synthase
MFTGIIETIGTITAIETEAQNIHFTVQSNISHELKIDQSVSHDGVCLTVTEVNQNQHKVTAIAETLRVTALKNWVVNKQVNLERCLPANGRFDGHIVQGHVDTVAVCSEVINAEGSWYYHFKLNGTDHQNLIVPKGSVCINGISLTVVEAHPDSFSVAIIPYTYEHTNMHDVAKGSEVNIEFDIIGKYIARNLQMRL